LLRRGKRILTGDADAGTKTKTRGRAKLAARYPAEMQFETIEEAAESFVRQVNEKKKNWDDAKMESCANVAFDHIDVLNDTAYFNISTYFNSVDFEVFAQKFCDATMHFGEWQVKDEMFAQMYQILCSYGEHEKILPILCSLPSFSFVNFFYPDGYDGLKFVFFERFQSWEASDAEFETFAFKFFAATMYLKLWSTLDEMFSIICFMIPDHGNNEDLQKFEKMITSLASKRELYLVKTMTGILNLTRQELDKTEKELSTCDKIEKRNRRTIEALQRDVKSEKERRLVCEESLTRCVQELQQARAEIRDLQMRD